MIKKLLLLLFILNSSTMIYAQRVSISTDVLKWASLSPNMAVDLVLAPRISLNMEGVYDPLISRDLKRVSVSTELRYWFKRPFYSHYLGVNFIGAMYDLKLPSGLLKGHPNKYRGSVAGIGIGYGYSVIVNKRFSFTPNIGFGYGLVHSQHNFNGTSSPTFKSEFKPILTRLGLSFSYIIN